MDSGRSRRVTHRDVARRAGVSPAVVSYVVNNGPRATSAEARARVLRAIEELDYHPHAFARGLRSQRTHTIGFLARDYSPLDVFVSPYSAGVLTGLAAELKEHGYYLLVHPLLIGEDLTTSVVCCGAAGWMAWWCAWSRPRPAPTMRCWN
jgi:LacI family transcriptional regulator